MSRISTTTPVISRNLSKKACACGNPAYRMKTQEPVCQRCDALEHIYAKNRRDTWQPPLRPREDYYLPVYAFPTVSATGSRESIQ